MNEQTIAAFFDEVEKIAMAGGMMSQSSAPKTSAPTPAPAAKLAPTPAMKPPSLAPPKSAISAVPKAIGNPGQKPQAASARRLSASAPKLNRGTLKPRVSPVPNVRAVATLPVRRPSGPAFLPGNRGMPQTAGLGIT